MTIYDLIYQTTAQIKIEDAHRMLFVCSKCGKSVGLKDTMCPHCKRSFLSEHEIEDMTEKLISDIARIIIKNVRGE